MYDAGDEFQDISISHSPKGWTDQELGEMWIKKDFEPATAAKNVTGGYRLLILDGHNSHCTYGFCKFAADRNIIIICLPSHTTHALQPCDVACFGPLASAWKSEVNSASADYVEITKQNLLVFYAKARERALKKRTIISAFAKTGIWPFNRHILEPSAFEPSKNTTTEPAQPLPTRLPTLLIPIQVHHGNTNLNAPAIENEVRYIIPLPPALPYAATRVDLRLENQMLRDTLRLAEVQLEKDFTQMTLMDMENGRLRKRAYAKEKKKAEKKETTQAHARLMTGTENLDALAEKDFMKQWKEVAKELVPIFKRIRKEIGDHDKSIAQAAKDVDKARKAEERAAKKAAAEAEKARKKAARAEAAAAKKAAQGRGRGGNRVWSRGRGRGRGEGLGRNASGIDSEDDSDGEDFDDIFSSSESSGKGKHSQSSDAATGTEEDQFGDAYEDMAAVIPPLPRTTEQEVPPRPRPRPQYWIPAPAVDVGDNGELPEGGNGTQPQIGGAFTVDEVSGEAGNVAEGEDAAETGCRYPRRLNRTNIHFMYGVDA